MKWSLIIVCLSLSLVGCTCNEEVEPEELPEPLRYPVDTTAMMMRPRALFEDRIYTTDFDNDGVRDTVTPYLRRLTADLDLDEETEELFLETNVEVVNGEPMWKNEHIWWVYVVDGYRDTTMLFSGPLSTSRLEIGLGVADTVDARPIYLVQRGDTYLRTIEYLYFSPNEYDFRELVGTRVTDWAR